MSFGGAGGGGRPLQISGEMAELPLRSLDEDHAIFGSAHNFDIYGDTSVKMPRGKWVELDRPLKIRVIIQPIHKEDV